MQVVLIVRIAQIPLTPQIILTVQIAQTVTATTAMTTATTVVTTVVMTMAVMIAVTIAVTTVVITMAAMIAATMKAIDYLYAKRTMLCIVLFTYHAIFINLTVSPHSVWSLQ